MRKSGVELSDEHQWERVHFSDAVEPRVWFHLVSLRGEMRIADDLHDVVLGAL